MGKRRESPNWLKYLGLFASVTSLGHMIGSFARNLGYFFNQTLVGRTLLFASIPLALLIYVIWPEDYMPPIFDVQVHYNEESWRRVSTDAIFNTIEEINVPWLLVGSTPNEGTRKLYRANPDKVIPMLVPQFTAEDRHNWFTNPKIQRYMEKELGSGFYRGVGEFFLFDGQTDTPVVKRMVELASKHNLVLHARSDPIAISQLFAMDSSLRILWAHAGMFTQADTVSELLDRHPQLWVEISHRGDIAPRGKLDKKWREVILRHSDRFMLGSGTYSLKYWYQFRNYMRRYRGWLQELPIEVAERIAFRNGLFLFDIKYKSKNIHMADFGKTVQITK